MGKKLWVAPIALGTALQVVAGPARAQAAHADPPAGYHRETRPHRGALLAGAITFGTSYAAAVLFGIALTASRPVTADGAWLFLPLAGPFVFLTHPWPPESVAALRPIIDANLVADGIVQCIGVALLTYGLTAPTTVVVPDRAGGLRLIPVPMVLGRGAAGAGVIATF